MQAEREYIYWYSVQKPLHRSGFTSRSCVICVFVCEYEAGTEKGLALKRGIRLEVRGRRRVPEVRLAEVEAHLAAGARKGGKEAVAHSVGGELKDHAVRRRKAPVDRDVYLHRVQVARETDDVARLPRARVWFFAIGPLELPRAVNRPKVRIVADTVA